MAIIGLGNDLVEIDRIEQVLQRTPDRFAARVLTPNELRQFQQHKQPARFLAKRFAAKEAAAKAIGTGIAAGVTFQDFEVSNNAAGRPLLTLSGQALQLANAQAITNCWLSLSDERHYALATVVLESVSP
ncbi:holo-[acyl-carrier-protein] synthase [Neiella marina]|uniref:Holo-[acyl-carrier-protein] synthase n=1 Tax=Neiella marina TaxID=508461 RepID=A0A8J2U4C3_9GAMM|nr:holo-ACP synthase [Neiella marina]GGA74792.1 holo-[acyl-carrier-protein] synthase [Neiella marina]